MEESPNGQGKIYQEVDWLDEIHPQAGCNHKIEDEIHLWTIRRSKLMVTKVHATNTCTKNWFRDYQLAADLRCSTDAVFGVIHRTQIYHGGERVVRRGFRSRSRGIGDKTETGLGF